MVESAPDPTTQAPDHAGDAEHGRGAAVVGIHMGGGGGGGERGGNPGLGRWHQKINCNIIFNM